MAKFAKDSLRGKRQPMITFRWKLQEFPNLIWQITTAALPCENDAVRMELQ